MTIIPLQGDNLSLRTESFKDTKLNREKQLYITLLPEGIQNKFAFQQTFIRMYYLCFSLTDLIS